MIFAKAQNHKAFFDFLCPENQKNTSQKITFFEFDIITLLKHQLPSKHVDIQNFCLSIFKKIYDNYYPYPVHTKRTDENYISKYNFHAKELIVIITEQINIKEKRLF